MNDTASRTRQEKQFTGWHMLAIMVAFFGVIISVNVFMAVSAVRTWTGLVVKNSYVASQEFNTKLANANAQAAMGWTGGLEYSDGELLFTLSDGEAIPLKAETVTIALSRPIGVEGDQTVSLSRQQDGSYLVPVVLTPGAWNAVILASFADQPDYEHRARLNVGN